MKSIRILIIDDEQLARDMIKSYLSTDNQVETIDECADGFDGFKKINELKPDLIFLDIMMPKLTGFEMLELVENPPVVIFSTAYDEYALKAFESNAIDYLLKPYSKYRFDEALKKAKEKILSNAGSHVQKVISEIKQSQNELLNRVALRHSGKIHIIGIQEIDYIESMDDYVKIHTSNGCFVKQSTMKYFENSLPPNDFIRIHRSFILNIRNLSKIEPYSKDTYIAILNNNIELQVSRSGFSKLKEALNF